MTRQQALKKVARFFANEEATICRRCSAQREQFSKAIVARKIACDLCRAWVKAKRRQDREHPPIHRRSSK
jgi:hypothetical protein